jgi:hypothetical protein
VPPAHFEEGAGAKHLKFRTAAGKLGRDRPHQRLELQPTPRADTGRLGDVMKTIGDSEILSFLSGSRKVRRASNSDVREDDGHHVSSFVELAGKVAELQFRNWDHVLMFRGQDDDHKNRARATSLKPSLFRSRKGQTANPGQGLLSRRFRYLDHAEQRLASVYAFLGKNRVQRHRILRWSILQHYEICRTPLLDVTHSLRIAASFASLTRKQTAYVFVLGVPNLSGAVTASAEAGLQIIRLASVCPPDAKRPHIQEGYLLGEYPDISDFRQKQLFDPHEIDLGRRLVAKFRFNPRTFWKDPTFPEVPETALYPSSASDKLCELAMTIKKGIGRAPQ